jgi:hypothetical protein
VLAQVVDLEHPPGDAVRHHRGVHLVLRGQGAAVERGEPGGPAVKRVALAGQGLRRWVGQPRVEPVVTKPGGGIRVPFGPVVQVLPGQLGELGIGLAHRTPFQELRTVTAAEG